MEKINERQNKIVELVLANDFVTVKDLGQELNVSLVTIRKDLTLLEEKGLLYRTHGGASKRKRYAFERSISEKEQIEVEAKTKIAKKATSLIRENDFVIIASGTTLLYMTRELKDSKRLNVLTSSIGAALNLSNNPLIDTILLGGDVRKSSKSVIGGMAEKMLMNFSAHTLFLGVDGIDLNFGISTSNSAEAQLNKVMITQSNRVVVLADSSKINKRGFGRIADIDEVDVLITDKEIDPKFRQGLEEIGVEIIVVE